MNPPDVHAGNAERVVEPLPGQVPLGRNGRTAENSFVKRAQLFPIVRHEVGVGVSGLNGHIIISNRFTLGPVHA